MIIETDMMYHSMPSGGMKCTFFGEFSEVTSKETRPGNVLNSEPQKEVEGEELGKLEKGLEMECIELLQVQVFVLVFLSVSVLVLFVAVLVTDSFPQCIVCLLDAELELPRSVPSTLLSSHPQFLSPYSPMIFAFFPSRFVSFFVSPELHSTTNCLSQRTGILYSALSRASSTNSGLPASSAPGQGRPSKEDMEDAIASAWVSTNGGVSTGFGTRFGLGLE